ncbi:MAG: hypothetical protein ACLQLH_17320, partial [Terracidiphilus sp.]
TNEDISQAVRPLLNLSRGMIRRSGKLEYDLISSLERDPLLRERGNISIRYRTRLLPLPALHPFQ